ncbi:hypothetical protein P3T73_12235 [Kiritimatiellota bacterium B12222]|nr:hypothetical protein P3T73_12235 [Kiritimatiellota bacterium B12222]
MTKIEKILVPLVLIAAGTMSILWITEHQTSNKLAMALKETEINLEKEAATNRGLKKANAELQNRLLQAKQVASELRVTPRQVFPDIDVEEMDDATFLTANIREPVAPKDPQTPTILSPEELAAEKQREEERAQRDAERQQRREEYAARVQTDIQNRRDFFSQINTEGLAPEYIDAHNKLLASLDSTQLLMEKMADPDLPREERREIGRELWQQSRDMDELMDMQRDVLLSDYAELSLGLSAGKAEEFMQYMETVNEMTSGSPMRGGGGGGRRGGGR